MVARGVVSGLSVRPSPDLSPRERQRAVVGSSGQAVKHWVVVNPQRPRAELHARSHERDGRRQGGRAPSRRGRGSTMGPQAPSRTSAAPAIVETQGRSSCPRSAARPAMTPRNVTFDESSSESAHDRLRAVERSGLFQEQGLEQPNLGCASIERRPIHVRHVAPRAAAMRAAPAHLPCTSSSRIVQR